MPNLTEFMNIKLPGANKPPPEMPRVEDISLPRNQWYYEFEEKPNLNKINNQQREPQSESRSSRMSWSMVLLILVVIDVVWFIHRMACTYSTAKMILYGCPSFVDCKKSAGMFSMSKVVFVTCQLFAKCRAQILQLVFC